MSPLSPGIKTLLFALLGLTTFMIVLDYSIANVAIPYIAGDLAVSNDEGTYVITLFAVGNAIGLAMTSWVTKRVGEIRTMTISILLFTLFSLLCGLSVSLNMLVTNRFIQGLVGGPIIPLSNSLILKYGTPQSKAKDLSIWSMVVITGPVIGPILGGYIADWYSWPWIFYINIPVGLACAALIWTLMRDRESPIENTPGDYVGIFLLILSVTCLQIFLDKGQEWDWFRSEHIWMLLIGMVVGFTYLIIHELWTRYPVLDLSLFKIPSFTLAIVILFVSYAMYFGSVVLIPLWLQEYMNYNAEWAGLAVCTLGIAPFFLSLMTPFLVQKLGIIQTLMISFVCFSIGCFIPAYFTPQVSVGYIALSRLIFGFGFICYIAPLINLATFDIPAQHLSAATGMFHFIRSVSGGIGTAIFSTIWIRRTIFHHHRLGDTLTPFTTLLPPIPDKSTLAQLNNALDQQAAILAVNDALYLMGWLYAGLLVLLIGWRIYRYFHPKKARKSVETITVP